ncbi:MAG: ribonuclease [Methanobrevibacter sp.]|uniref:Ribonuclease n=1 Tax=Methanobrevibacter millerae TaxID=230361 RepID=A0A8T3VF33_9EURY|nr:ribonuclease domain-containing protein [Methanobrevibacter millerae]MBE6504806.1 ribonuclease [Methanobrevibacter millerae]MBR0057865.1 ribonuclease [Methanobrevibacter sp.]MBR0370484.1 ribonuclease [Methanobrevibacter sp.]
MDKRFIFIFAIFLIAIFAGLSVISSAHIDKVSINKTDISENGQYCTVNEVAAYIKEYHKLPSNYITKSQAKDLGWSGGPLKKYAPGKSIGGDTFTNRQGVLPKSSDKYIECDINANGTNRGAERIVFNTGDFRVYYTGDHYNTFVELK